MLALYVLFLFFFGGEGLAIQLTGISWKTNIKKPTTGDSLLKKGK